MQGACKLAYGFSAMVAGSLHHANVSAHAEQSSRAGQYHAADRRVTFTLSRSLRQSLNEGGVMALPTSGRLRVRVAMPSLLANNSGSAIDTPHSFPPISDRKSTRLNSSH